MFSPITAEMEPVDIGNKNENLYDCYILSCVQAMPSSGGQTSQIQRKVNWMTLNPYGEILQRIGDGSRRSKEGLTEGVVDQSVTNHVLPSFESFNFERSDVMEEDVMGNEPGLVYFEVRCNPVIIDSLLIS